jgi:hypothetical protein
MDPPPSSVSIGINLEWFRPDPRPRLYRTYGLMVFLLLVGMGCCAAGFLGLRMGSETSEVGATLLLVLGVGAVASAMILMVRKAVQVLADETCLVLRVDGLLFVRQHDQFVVPWERIDAIEAQNDRVLIRTDDPQLGVLLLAPRFADVDASQLAEKMITTRRSALMGLYPRSH